MLASRTARDFEGMGFVPVVTADPTLTFFDGTTRSDTLDAEAWGFYLRVLKAHPSQFPLTDADLATLADAAASNKRVYLADLADATPDDPLYVDLCAPSTFPE